MPRSFKLYITGVVALSAVALAVATLVFPADSRIALSVQQIPGAIPSNPSAVEMMLGIGFWTAMTIIASALPVKLPHGTYQAVALAPLVAAISLGGPAVGGWDAVIGTTETRELRGRIPWYGTLMNHAGIVLPAVVAGVI